MVNKQMLVEADSFFKEEQDELKNELEADKLLVDIACEFIKYRAKNGLTQKDLADKLNVSQTMISKLESGDYNPTVKTLFDIAKKLCWNFKIEFNEVTQKYYYQYECQEEADKMYFDNMGLAS